MGIGRWRNLILLCLSILALALLTVGGFLLKKGITGYILGVSSKSAEDIAALTADLEECEPEDEEILLNGNKAPFAKESGTLYIPQNADDNGYSGHLTCNGARLVFLDDDRFLDPAEAIKDAAEFDLYVIYPDRYSRVTAVFTGSPVIELNGLYDLGDETFGGYVEVTDPYLKGGDRFVSTACNFGVRGDISRGYPKKGYSLKLTDRTAPLLGMRDDDDWILNALYDDIGMVRNKTAYELWNEISASNSLPNDNTVPSFEYVDVIKDGEYLGVYGFFERLDNKTLGVYEDETIYKIIHYETEDNFEKTVEIAYPLPRTDADGNEIPWSDEDKRDMCLLLQKMCDEDPDDGVCLWDDAVIENAVDYNIFCMVLAAHDNLSKNSYYTVTKKEDGAFDFYEVPWDLNATFGIINEFYYSEDKITSSHEWSLAGRRLFLERPEEFTKLTLERWNYLRGNVLSEENVREIIDENLDHVEKTGAMKRNLKRWPRVQFTKTDKAYDELWNVEDLYDFVSGRFAFLDEFFKDPVLVSWEDEGSSDQQGLGSSDR